MTYKRYKMLQKYINGEAQEEYKQGELIDDTTYETLEDCNEGNQNPDKPIEGYIYQWVTVSGEYVCSGVNKYTKQKEQKSSNNGVTWTDTGRTRQGDLIEVNSADCGYVPPTPTDYSAQYFTIESLEDDNVIKMYPPVPYVKTVQVSTDNGYSWRSIELANVNTGSLLATINSGEKLLVKSNGRLGDENNKYNITASKQFIVYGNILSLSYGDNFDHDYMPHKNNFMSLFAGSNKLISAENLILPSIITDSVFANMFGFCTALRTAPALPATNLYYRCYINMFRGCTSLTTAPTLPATTLARECYEQMFNGCTSLNNITCLATDISAYMCTSNWLNGVAASGTFTKASSMTDWTTGVDGIPSGWNVINR